MNSGRMILQPLLHRHFREAVKIERIKCPYCGYEMPVRYDPEHARAEGLYVRCKGRDCKREFEIIITEKKKEVK